MTDALTFAGFLHQVSPTYRWDYPHLQYIQGALQLMTDRVTLKLMILSPPRHIKTAMTTVRYAAHRRARQPDLRVLLSGPSQQLANNYSRRAALVAGGAFRAAGVGEALVGYGADLIIIDDPIRLFDPAGAVELERMYDWYTSSVATRLLPGARLFSISRVCIRTTSPAGSWPVRTARIGRWCSCQPRPRPATRWAALYQQRPRDR